MSCRPPASEELASAEASSVRPASHTAMAKPGMDIVAQKLEGLHARSYACYRPTLPGPILLIKPTRLQRAAIMLPPALIEDKHN